MKQVRKKVYLILKRIIDIIAAIILLIILFIPFLIVSVFIKIEDNGSILYKQLRVGKDLKIFKIYKFRSMRTNRKELNSNMTYEQMVTKVGKFIRKTNIDELPQIINILKGEMSFIGPRPWIPEYYTYFTDEQKQRSNVLPGITGLAQAKGRNNISIFEKINYDLEYVNKFGLIMDIKIIFLTIKELMKKSTIETSEQMIKVELEELKQKGKI